MTKPTTIKSKMDAIFNQIAQLRRVINIATSGSSLIKFDPENCPLALGADERDGYYAYHRDAITVLGYRGRHNPACPLCDTEFEDVEKL